MADVGGVHLVMPQRRRRVVRGAGAVHERDRPERRRADGVELDEHPAAGHRPRPVGAKVHDEIVRVLVVDERRLLVCLTGLENLRRPECLDRERLERQHRVQPEQLATDPALARSHQPVLRLHSLEVREFPQLVVEADEDIGVPGPRPRGLSRWRHHHLDVLGLRLRRRFANETDHHQSRQQAQQAPPGAKPK